MKYLYIILGLLSLVSFSSQAQDWNPFPYDSVYFINTETREDVLIPVFKSSDTSKLLVDMSVRYEYEYIKKGGDFEYLQRYDDTLGMPHWFGEDLSVTSGHLNFSSMFFDEYIDINLNMELGDHYITPFYLNNEKHHVKIVVGDVYFDQDANDTLKSIQLILLDSSLNNVSYESKDYPPYDNGCMHSILLRQAFSSEEKRILIGKTTGVHEIPNLAFYPFCRSYKPYKTSTELFEVLKTPILHSGDVIQGSKRSHNAFNGNSSGYKFRYKITDLYINTVEERLEYIYESWVEDKNTRELTYKDNQTMTMSYGTYDEIFNGVDTVSDGRQPRLLLMDSHWGLPIIRTIRRYDIHPLTEFDVLGHLLHVIDLNSSGSTSLNILSECLTYYNISGQEYGEDDEFYVTAMDSPEGFQAVLFKNEIEVNKPITGDVLIYNLNGALVQTVNMNAVSSTIPISSLDFGVYMVCFKEVNKVMKLVRQP